MMTPIERFQALLDGKKLRRFPWEKDVFIHLCEDGKYPVWSNGGSVCGLCGPDYEKLWDPSFEWEIYEEPKSEIKLTSDMVGRKVKLRNGQIQLICGFTPNKYPFEGHMYVWTEKGANNIADCFDFVEILD